MHYQISRNSQMYGPYTLEDLHRYLASGNVLPTDLAKSEEMAEWVPVGQMLEELAAAPAVAPAVEAAPETGFSSPSLASGAYADAAGGRSVFDPLGAPSALANSPYPDAPDLHWGLVLLFGLLTCTLFMYVWNLIVCAWLKRVQPNAGALFIYATAVVLLIVRTLMGLGTSMHRAFGHAPIFSPTTIFGFFLGVIIWVVRLVARFNEKSSLEEHFNTVEPVGLRLSGVMVFFFGGVYLQYKLNEINAMKRAARFGAPGRF